MARVTKPSCEGYKGLKRNNQNRKQKRSLLNMRFGVTRDFLGFRGHNTAFRLFSNDVALSVPDMRYIAIAHAHSLKKSLHYIYIYLHHC